MDNILSLTSVQDINSEIKRLTAENYVFSESQIETIKVKRNGLQPSQTEEERPVAQGETPKEYTEFKENTSDEEVATGFSSLGDELGTFSEEDEENLDSDRQQEIRNEADIDPNLDPDLEKYKTVEEAYRIRSLADALFSKIINNFDDNYYQLNKAGEQLGMDIESVQDIKNMSINDRLRLLDNICK
jgi:NACalpha-BTF3-like transcription factor